MFVFLIAFWAISIAAVIAWVAWALVRHVDRAPRRAFDERRARDDLYGGPRHIEIQPRRKP